MFTRGTIWLLTHGHFYAALRSRKICFQALAQLGRLSEAVEAGAMHRRRSVFVRLTHFGSF